MMYCSRVVEAGRAGGRLPEHGERVWRPFVHDLADELPDQVTEVVARDPGGGPRGVVTAVGEQDGPRLRWRVAHAAHELGQVQLGGLGDARGVPADRAAHLSAPEDPGVSVVAPLPALRAAVRQRGRDVFLVRLLHGDR